MSEAERKKFSSVLLQKPEQFVKLMFAECLETGIAQHSLPFCASHINMACVGPPAPADVHLSRTLTAHLNEPSLEPAFLSIRLVLFSSCLIWFDCDFNLEQQKNL